MSCWHGLFPVGGTRSPHSLEDLADLGQRHGRGAKLGWRKANRGSVDMKQFDSVRVVGQCRPGAPPLLRVRGMPDRVSLPVESFGVANGFLRLTCCRVINLVLGVTRSSSRSPYNHAALLSADFEKHVLRLQAQL